MLFVGTEHEQGGFGMNGFAVLTVGFSSDGFAVIALQVDEVCRVTLAGELDMFTCKLLHKQLEDAHGRVIVDCEDLTFADSTGIGVLIQIANSVESLTLLKPPIAIRRVIEMLGLTEVLRIDG